MSATLNARGTAEPTPDLGFRRSQNFVLSESSASVRHTDGSTTHIVRGQNFLISFTDVAEWVTLQVDNCPDEHLVILAGAQPEGALSVDGHTRRVTEPSVLVVPPGSSSLTTTGPAVLIRVFTARGGRFLRAVNESAYAEPDPRVTPLDTATAPPGGYRARVYPLSAARPEPGIFGRIYQSSTAMVNVFEEHEGPRDPDQLSPHAHADFEQCTITLSGDYIHHFRTPWTARSSQWRPDEHVASPSPSITVIPAGVIHTSQAVGEGTHALIDVFAPPRVDFAKAGWVRNAAGYAAEASHD